MDDQRSSPPQERQARERRWYQDALSARPRLISVARRIVRDLGEAEDVADEAIARLTTQIRGGGGVDSVGAWLHRTALRLGVDRARSWVRRQRPEWLAKAAVSSDRASETDRTDLREQVWRHLLELPARQREVLVLHQMEGLSYGEIGTLLEISESTARVHGHAGREAMRRRMSRQLRDGT